MPRRTLDNPIVLAVLGLLLEQASHPYQMLAELRQRSDSHAAAITRGTLYNTVAALNEAGWVAVQGQQRAGNRPERTVYALTDAGREELVRRLDDQIRNPEREFTRFLGAVTYLGALGPDGAVEALTERAQRLRQRTAADEERLASARSAGAPRLYVIEAEYALCLARAETAWIDSVIDDIRTGALTWPTT
ncbi:PadR family transcriptional regulator [Streptomyces sp. NRRL B-1677]|uniref:PadR family transcriptional regulator n=1 Tax=Streptomyces sp. NRRL B-1677 TaxID=2682966 RepID=UPI001892A098|nr:PadR family transcriptional regulator [Streptomyces sp. NRRL B-1677]MBF6049234.1 PadR family transcriptional regulator [Streptomyces sp. NRRL B-1677]